MAGSKAWNRSREQARPATSTPDTWQWGGPPAKGVAGLERMACLADGWLAWTDDGGVAGQGVAGLAWQGNAADLPEGLVAWHTWHTRKQARRGRSLAGKTLAELDLPRANSNVTEL